MTYDEFLTHGRNQLYFVIRLISGRFGVCINWTKTEVAIDEYDNDNNWVEVKLKYESISPIGKPGCGLYNQTGGEF